MFSRMNVCVALLPRFNHARDDEGAGEGSADGRRFFFLQLTQVGGLEFDSLRGRSGGRFRPLVCSDLTVLLTHPPPSSGRNHISCDQLRIRIPGGRISIGATRRRFSLNTPNKTVGLKLTKKKISHDTHTGPYKGGARVM